MLDLILMCFALVCFVLAATPLGAPRNAQLVAAGLAFWSAAVIFGRGTTLFTH